jgi:hypothetical protein
MLLTLTRGSFARIPLKKYIAVCLQRGYFHWGVLRGRGLLPDREDKAAKGAVVF